MKRSSSLLLQKPFHRLIFGEGIDQMNVLMSRMDEQQRRWYAAVESKRYGHGGIKLVSQITGLDDKTIRKGRQEMGDDLAERSRDRIRMSGGGRPRVEKNASGRSETARPGPR